MYFTISHNLKNIFIALLLAIFLILSIATKFTIITFILIIILTIIILIVFNSDRGSNYDGSLPSTTTPIPRHLGLDGISITNRYI